MVKEQLYFTKIIRSRNQKTKELVESDFFSNNSEANCKHIKIKQNISLLNKVDQNFDSKEIKCDAGSALLFTKEITIEEGIIDSGLIFFDIETTGLHPASVLFLAGIAYLEEKKLILNQFFARNHSEERALLCLTLEELQNCNHIYTFNGSRFDLPHLKKRCNFHSLEFPVTFKHTDLFCQIKRNFAHRTTRFDLNSIEHNVLNFKRVQDIDSRYIPQTYMNFVNNGDMTHIHRIIEHNQLDLLSTYKILLKVKGL